MEKTQHLFKVELKLFGKSFLEGPLTLAQKNIILLQELLHSVANGV